MFTHDDVYDSLNPTPMCHTRRVIVLNYSAFRLYSQSVLLSHWNVGPTSSRIQCVVLIVLYHTSASPMTHVISCIIIRDIYCRVRHVVTSLR